MHPPRTPLQAYAQYHRGVLGEWALSYEGENPVRLVNRLVQVQITLEFFTKTGVQSLRLFQPQMPVRTPFPRITVSLRYLSLNPASHPSR